MSTRHTGDNRSATKLYDLDYFWNNTLHASHTIVLGKGLVKISIIITFVTGICSFSWSLSTNLHVPGVYRSKTQKAYLDKRIKTEVTKKSLKNRLSTLKILLQISNRLTRFSFSSHPYHVPIPFCRCNLFWFFPMPRVSRINYRLYFSKQLKAPVMQKLH